MTGLVPLKVGLFILGLFAILLLIVSSIYSYVTHLAKAQMGDPAIPAICTLTGEFILFI